MNFDVQTEHIDSDALHLAYFLVPWDTAIIGRPVAGIASIDIKRPGKAADDYSGFVRWCENREIALCSCRIEQSSIRESLFLQDRGFRFVELNYRPRLGRLQDMDLPREDLDIRRASEPDREVLADMAGRIFHHGRFHQDPRLGPELGNRRYRAWMENSFTHPRQTTFKCLRDGEIAGFLVAEFPEPAHCFWSLVGLAPGLEGEGLGKKVFSAMLRAHREEGIDTVSTSVSSHNVAAFNLYRSLGFSFPAPSLTLHWHPQPAGEG